MGMRAECLKAVVAGVVVVLVGGVLTGGFPDGVSGQMPGLTGPSVVVAEKSVEPESVEPAPAPEKQPPAKLPEPELVETLVVAEKSVELESVDPVPAPEKQPSGVPEPVEPEPVKQPSQELPEPEPEFEEPPVPLRQNSEVPVVSISVVGEGRVAEGGSLVFRMSVTPRAAVPLKVGFYFSGGEAVFGEDFHPRIETFGLYDFTYQSHVVIPAGGPGATLMVRTVRDGVPETQESVVIRLHGGAGYGYSLSEAAADRSARGVIMDDGLAMLSVNMVEADREFVEGEPVPFEFRLPDRLDHTVLVSYRFEYSSDALVPFGRRNSQTYQVGLRPGMQWTRVFAPTRDNLAFARDQQVSLVVFAVRGALLEDDVARVRLDRAVRDNDAHTVSLVGVEVTQGTQSWDRSVRLVQNRSTAVRVFFELEELAARTFGEPDSIRVRGVVLRGQVVDENRQPVGEPFGVQRPLNDGVAVFRELADACLADDGWQESSCRGDLDSSLNFLVPNAWHAELAAGQGLRLEVVFPSHLRVLCEVPTGAVQVLDTNEARGFRDCEDNNAFTDTVLFEHVEPPTLVFAGAAIHNGMNNFDVLAAERDFTALRVQAQRALSVLPLPDDTEVRFMTLDQNDPIVNMSDVRLPAPTREDPHRVVRVANPDRRDISAAVLLEIDRRKRSDAAFAGLDDQNSIVVVVTDCTENCRGTDGTGAAFRGSPVRGFRVAWVDLGDTGSRDYYNRVSNRNTTAHELGHTLGQPHTFRGEGQGFCSEGGDTGGVVYPVAHRAALRQLGFAGTGSRRTQEVAGTAESVSIGVGRSPSGLLPLLGPATSGVLNRDSEVWGLDVYALKKRYGVAADFFPAWDGAWGDYPARGAGNTYAAATSPERLVASNPRHVFALMSYCSAVTGSPVQSRWLDADTHARVLDLIEQVRGQDPLVAAAGGPVEDTVAQGSDTAIDVAPLFKTAAADAQIRYELVTRDGSPLSGIGYKFDTSQGAQLKIFGREAGEYDLMLRAIVPSNEPLIIEVDGHSETVASLQQDAVATVPVRVTVMDVSLRASGAAGALSVREGDSATLDVSGLFEHSPPSVTPVYEVVVPTDAAGNYAASIAGNKLTVQTMEGSAGSYAFEVQASLEYPAPTLDDPDRKLTPSVPVRISLEVVPFRVTATDKAATLPVGRGSTATLDLAEHFDYAPEDAAIAYSLDVSSVTGSPFTHSITGSILTVTAPDVRNDTRYDLVLTATITDSDDPTQQATATKPLSLAVTLRLADITHRFSNDNTRLEIYSNPTLLSLPAEIDQLTNLTQLYIRHNSSLVSLPAELGQLTNLTQLNINGNDRLVSLPAELGQLTNLTQLNIWANDGLVSLPAELGQLTNLTQLFFWGNDGLVSLPAELGQLTNLTLLNIRSNPVLASLPAELGQLTNLAHLFIVGNDGLVSLPAELGQLTNLIQLYISNHDGLVSLPAELGQLANLTRLGIFDNDLLASLPAELGQLTNLTLLSIDGNDGLVSLPAELGRLTNLTWLDIRNNDGLVTLPAELGQLTNLTRLDIWDNSGLVSLPAVLRSLCNSTIGYCQRDR